MSGAAASPITKPTKYVGGNGNRNACPWGGRSFLLDFAFLCIPLLIKQWRGAHYHLIKSFDGVVCASPHLPTLSASLSSEHSCHTCSPRRRQHAPHHHDQNCHFHYPSSPPGTRSSRSAHCLFSHKSCCTSFAILAQLAGQGRVGCPPAFRMNG